MRFWLEPGWKKKRRPEILVGGCLVIVLAILAYRGLSGPEDASDREARIQTQQSIVEAPTAQESELARGPATERTEATDAILEHALETWTGDFDGMVKRGFVRVLTAYNPLFFSYDGASRTGLAIDIGRALEKHLRKLTGSKRGALHVVVIPVARDDLLPFLLAGKGDLVIANLTITPERQAQVDFSNPTYPGVNELVVTGPAAPDVASLNDLVATKVHIRKSSSYFEHLTAMNQARREAGQPEIPIVPVDELLEDYELLELVNVGLIPAVIVDSHKAALWAQVYEDIVVHEGLAIHRDGKIAWALRKENPKLKKVVNGFVKKVKKGTLLGNILIKRYLGNAELMDNVRGQKAWERYESTVSHIQKYAAQYDLDWLVIAAQGYQESKLDQSVRSKAGAVGVMQILPSTAADPNVGIEGIDQLGPNVHAGVRYLRFLKDRYFSDPEITPLDRILFALAAYNAGPGNIARARRKAAKMGLDPNRWFGNVEIAAARTISREPVVYVRNIYKYYVSYERIAALGAAKASLVD